MKHWHLTRHTYTFYILTFSHATFSSKQCTLFTAKLMSAGYMQGDGKGCDNMSIMVVQLKQFAGAT